MNKHSKHARRKHFLAVRQQLSPHDREVLDRRIGQHLVAQVLACRARCVGLFVPIGTEPDLLSSVNVLIRQGVRIALPVVVATHRPLLFLAYTLQTVLEMGQCGVLVPSPSSPVVQPDCLVVPCVAFDLYGYRLGYGKGFYDRTLAHERSIISIGVGYSCSQMAHTVPAAHDQRLTYVVTEQGLVVSNGSPHNGALTEQMYALLRQCMQSQSILIFGGSGFVGRALVRRLSVHTGVTVATRQREHAKALFVIPNVDVVEVDVDCAEAVYQLVSRGFACVINLAATLHGRRGCPYSADFEKAHVFLAKNIATACCRAKVNRFIQMSVLGAQTSAPSSYLRSRADADQVILAMRNMLALTVFRPSVIFGQEDQFLNMFARLYRSALPVFPIARAQVRFQPVWVENVVDALMASLYAVESYGQVYELGGPRVYTLHELVRYVGQCLNIQKPIVCLPDVLGYLQALVLEKWPGRTLMTRDVFDSMSVDSVSQQTFPFQIVPQDLTTVVPQYMTQVG